MAFYMPRYLPYVCLYWYAFVGQTGFVWMEQCAARMHWRHHHLTPEAGVRNWGHGVPGHPGIAARTNTKLQAWLCSPRKALAPLSDVPGWPHGLCWGKASEFYSFCLFLKTYVLILGVDDRYAPRQVVHIKNSGGYLNIASSYGLHYADSAMVAPFAHNMAFVKHVVESARFFNGNMTVVERLQAAAAEKRAQESGRSQLALGTSVKAVCSSVWRTPNVASEMVELCKHASTAGVQCCFRW